jgi:ParB/RepB/Spo0J family partition protein
LTPNSTPKKRGLGRGLDSLLETVPEKPPEGIRTLPIDSLRPNRFQPRTHFADAALEELADSIRAQGIVQPLVVTPEGEGWAIIAGERRWRAARMAGLEHVPVVVREVADDRELLELALVENLQRSDLNPIEESEAYAALQEKFGLSQEAVATRVGKARTTVLTVLEKLREKGYLTRRRQEGAFHYSPRTGKDEVLAGVVRRFVDESLGGAVSPFIAFLADAQGLTDAELAQLKDLVRNLEARPTVSTMTAEPAKTGLPTSSKRSDGPDGTNPDSAQARLRATPTHRRHPRPL